VKLVYMGTPDMAVPPLQALHAEGHEIVLVVSGADKRRGRRGSPTPSPVKAAALELGLPVSDDPDDLIGRGAEMGVVVAYGRLLRPHLLAELPMVNLHFSLLPRWRGAAPVERAVLAGDAVTGVCLMAVEEGLDTGCVYDRVEVPIEGATAASLRQTLVVEGTRLLVRALAAGLGDCAAQSDSGVTYAAKLTPADLRVDWHAPCAVVDRIVRVGGAWTTFRGERFKVHAASVPGGDGPDGGHGDDGGGGVPVGTIVAVGRGVGVRAGDGVVELVTVQPAGRPAMAAADWANGARPIGELLGDDEPDPS
jgi:methionyl-tRNA formyltransferase